MDSVIHIIGSDTSADMLRQVDALAGPGDTIVSIGPVRRHKGFDRKCVDVRTVFGSGAVAAVGIRKLTGSAAAVHAWSPQAASAAQWSAKAMPIVLSMPHLRQVHQTDIAISGCFDGLWSLTVPTDSHRRVLIALGLDPGRVFVLPPSAGTCDASSERRSRIRSQLGLDEDCFLLAAGGQMIHANGHKQACWAHAMARILNENVRLVFPSGGPARKMVENFARSTGYPREVFFTAERMPATDVFTAADAAVFLQRHDCGVGALADAMACGLCVLGADRPEIADCAPDSSAALLSPPSDMRQATDNLLTLASDAELRRRLGRQAAILAAEKFDPNATRAKLKAIYSTVLSRHS